MGLEAVFPGGPRSCYDDYRGVLFSWEILHGFAENDYRSVGRFLGHCGNN